jgi:carbonic anhydrase
VKGACDGVQLGHLDAVLGNIAPAVAASRAAVPAPHDGKNAAFVGHVTEANVRLQAKALAERSPILAKRVADGQLVIVAALYDVASGQVRFLD